MNLGEAIRSIRQKKGLSQGEMQKRTGILRSYLSRVENGHTLPSFATLQRLASAMEVDLEDFFPNDSLAAAGLSSVSHDYLQEIKQYMPQLTRDQRQELMEMVKRMAQTSKQ